MSKRNHDNSLTAIYTLPPTDLVLSFSTPSQTVLESDQFATVCVNRSNTSVQIVTARITVVPDTANSAMGKEGERG